MKPIPALLVSMTLLVASQSNSTAETPVKPKEPKFKISEIWATGDGLLTPESVLYDPERKLLYVANMNKAEDGPTGFISRLSLDGKVLDLKWIDGLNEPRGMGLHGKLLYATDHNRIIAIDVEKGEVVEKVNVEGAKFLNDLAVSGNGDVMFSDSKDGKVYKYSGGKVTVWLDGLDGPNGLFNAGERLWIGESGAKKVLSMSWDGKDKQVVATGLGVDGIEYTGIGDYYLLTEWPGTLSVSGTGGVQPLLDTREAKINCADIGYNPDKKVIYVPTFFNNRVVAYQLQAE